MQLQSWRLGATMFTVFGAVALVLTAFGLFSMISFAVAQRQHEFSVRTALGARPADVRRLVLFEGAGIAATGVVAGLLLATVYVGRYVEPLLFGVSPGEPVILGIVPMVLLCVALTRVWRRHGARARRMSSGHCAQSRLPSELRHHTQTARGGVEPAVHGSKTSHSWLRFTICSSLLIP